VKDSQSERLVVADDAAPAENEELVYKIQFLTSNKKLKANDYRLKGLSPVNYYYENGIYKYTYGILTDKKEALSLQNEIKKKFKEAFIVVFKGNKRVK
jgi:N-acetylmuramoyl-L-alanine amidase